MPNTQRAVQVVLEGSPRSGTALGTLGIWALSATPYASETRFRDEPPGNHERLVAVAHGAGYSQALAKTLMEKGCRPRGTGARSACSLTPQRSGLETTKTRVEARFCVPEV